MTTRQTNNHILYSFRRCPYAIRTRMTLSNSGIGYEHREVLLKDKPPELLTESPKGTVPVLVLNSKNAEHRRVLDESIDIMQWALAQNDPDGWRNPEQQAQARIENWLADFESTFKPNLDAYKYGRDSQQQAQQQCEFILHELNQRLSETRYLWGEQLGYADVGVFPFIRQYVNVDPKQFAALKLAPLTLWLDALLNSALFLDVMQKHPLWTSEEGM